MLNVFIGSNIVILAGYFAAAVVFATWFLAIKQWKMLVWATTSFFALCASTHIELAAHAVGNSPITIDTMRSWHMNLIHVPQAVSIWLAVLGLTAARSWVNSLLLQIDDLTKKLHDQIEDLGDFAEGSQT